MTRRREYAYGPALGLPTPQLGAFTQALYEPAKRAGWTVVNMKDDWQQVFPFEPSPVTAVNILLESDATMLQRSDANGGRVFLYGAESARIPLTNKGIAEFSDYLYRSR